MHSQHSLNARLLRFRSQPQSEDAYALAQDLLDAQRYADARNVVALANTGDYQDAALLLLEARAHLLERDLIRAQAALLQTIKLAPELQQAYRYLGEVLLKRGDPQRAQKTLRRALSLRPDDQESAALLTRAEYLAEAANDSLEALPSPLDTEGTGQAAAGAPPDSVTGGRADEMPLMAAGERPLAASGRAAGRERLIVPKARSGRPRRDDEPTSQFRHGRRAQPSGAPAHTQPAAASAAATARQSEPRSDLASSSADSRAAPPPLPSARAAATSKRELGPSSAQTPRQASDVSPAAVARRAGAAADAAAVDATAAADAASVRDESAGLPEASVSPQAAVLDPNARYGKRLSDFRSDRSSARSAIERPQSRSDSVQTLPLQAASVDEPQAGPGVQDITAAADADQVLSVVRALGLFEQPSAQPASWAPRSELPVRGQRVRAALTWLWAISLLLCAAGYFGWNELVKRRHQAAADLVRQAHALQLLGDHAALVDAERLLRMARAQHPASLEVAREALFLQAERVLEDGEHDLAALRSAYTRARAAQVAGPALPLAEVLMSAALLDGPGRDKAFAQLLSTAGGDARALYLAGRAEDREGRAESVTHLEAAAHADPKLIPAQLALAEHAYARGERAAALRLLDGAAVTAPGQLRVRLFRMLVAADDTEPNSLRAELNELAEAMRKGGSIDQAYAGLIRARLARRTGERKAAVQALTAAAQSGVEVARVLQLLAREALALDELPLAQQLASRAFRLVPQNAAYRRLFARVLLSRGAGQPAFALLSALPDDDPEVQSLEAQAALLAGAPEMLRAALASLPAAGKKAEPRLSALRLRIETRLSPNKALLERARSLARSAQTDPDAQLALAEAALALHDPKLAQAALKQREALVPNATDTQLLLGRSLRMSGDAEAAEAALRRALELAPGNLEAQAALAGLLLDRGQYAPADALYRELSTQKETALAGRVGRVEALLGLAQLDDAQVQLEAVAEAERATVAYREVAAKLRLARGEPAEALKLLAVLSEEQPQRASLRALHGDALLAAQQRTAAAAEYAAALQLDPELPEALLGRAEIELQSNKTKDAWATLLKAAASLKERIRPAALQARRLILVGRTLLQRKKRGDADAAVRALREASALEGAPADAFFYLAEALSAKDKPAAQQAYRRYLELAPSGVHRQRAQRMLGAAR